MEPYSPPARLTPTQRRKAALAARDGGWWCTYCGCALVPADRPGDPEFVYVLGGAFSALPGYQFPTEDHVLPRTRGGSDDLDNLVLACQPCNTDKGAQPLAKWLERLMDRAWAEDRHRTVLA